MRWCRLLLSGKWRDRLLARSAVFGPTRWCWRLIERATLPGIVAHHWHRKHHIEARCRNALAQGVRRVVVLGAGFDTLVFRLAPEFPEVEFIEIDHPATQGRKARGEGDCARMCVSWLVIFQSIHLPDECIADSRATLLIAEGLLMYFCRAKSLSVTWRTGYARFRQNQAPIFTFMCLLAGWPQRFRPYSRWVDVTYLPRAVSRFSGRLKLALWSAGSGWWNVAARENHRKRPMSHWMESRLRHALESAGAWDASGVLASCTHRCNATARPRASNAV